MRQILLGLLLYFAIPSYACLNDMDSLAAEAKGLPGTLEVITGRFERNSSLFYEMRLARVAKEIKANPAKLELYDDAGVACDRLHRDKEAIAWMRQKRAQLKPYPQDKEHWYRYHANLGTFQAHLWLRNGANRKNIGEMKTARDNIKRAIQIKPDAHFGREKYQLMAMEWIIKPPKNKDAVATPGFLQISESAQPKEAHEAVTGLIGLIAMGNAWESIDTFSSLSKALTLDTVGNNGYNSLAYMAELRVFELDAAGKKSLAPKVPRGRKQLQASLESDFGGVAMNIGELETQYKELRAESNEFQTRRTNYMMERLKAGRHPDMDKTFWNEWKDDGPPSLGDLLSPQQRFFRNLQIAINILLASLVGLVGFFIWRFYRKRQKVHLST